MLALSANAWALSIIRDDEAETVIRKIGDPIFKAAGLSPKSVSLYIINQEEPNAFVMGGQNIFISTGLLNFSDDPEILAGVLAHETGHIIGGHLIQASGEMRNARNTVLMGFLAGALLGVAAKSPEAAIGTISGVQSMAEGQMMSFSRAQESAADSTSARIMNKLGVSSSGIIGFLRSLGTNERLFYGEISTYQRTHPLSQSRIDFLQSATRNGSTQSYLTQSIKDRFKMVRAKIFAFTAPSSSIMHEYGKSESGPAIYAKSILYFRENKKKPAIQELDKLIALSPNSPYLLELKAQILFELGQADEAVIYYQKAYMLKPSSELINMEYAAALISANKNLNTAAKLLKYVVSVYRDEPYAWNLLGKVYKKAGDDDNMHIAFAFEAYLRGDLTTARKQLNSIKNKASLPDDAQKRLKDIDNLIKSAPLMEEE
jgi:predicted Zn-dependent protease